MAPLRPSSVFTTIFIIRLFKNSSHQVVGITVGVRVKSLILFHPLGKPSSVAMRLRIISEVPAAIVYDKL
jgi:hypothetical protein